MSYSFTVRAPSKAEALRETVTKFEALVAAQPLHERDRAAVLANVASALALLADEENRDIMVSCNGYLSWHHDQNGTRETEAITAVSISCHVGTLHREPA